jgi:hypothetical protein
MKLCCIVAGAPQAAVRSHVEMRREFSVRIKKASCRCDGKKLNCDDIMTTSAEESLYMSLDIREALVSCRIEDLLSLGSHDDMLRDGGAVWLYRLACMHVEQRLNDLFDASFRQ